MKKKRAKKHIQACDISGSLYGKRTTSKKPLTKKTVGRDSKEMKSVYNKFYKNQLQALYKAIHGE